MRLENGACVRGRLHKPEDGVESNMRYTSDDNRRYAFRDWLRHELARLDFYQRRGDRYLVSEFARYADQLGARVEEVSLGRYLREENPVLPTPESCRELARALGRHPAEVLLEAGYLTPEDFFYMPSVGMEQEELTRQLQEIDRYTYVPEAIRSQMKASLERQIEQVVPSVQEQMRQRPSRPSQPAAPETQHSTMEQNAPAARSGAGREGRPGRR